MNFKERLELAMQAGKLNQKSLGDAVGISQVAMSKIINGLTADPGKIVEIAESCNVSAHWLKLNHGPKDLPDLFAKTSPAIGSSVEPLVKLNLEAVEFAIEMLRKSLKGDEFHSLDRLALAKSFSRFYEAAELFNYDSSKLNKKQAEKLKDI